jgi:hypothetical protein
LSVSVTQTLAGLQRSSGSAVRSSMLKRALLRKDPTFNEADYGFRAFGELLRHLADRKVIRLTEDEGARGDPLVEFTEEGSGQAEAFAVLATAVGELQTAGGPPALSGLKNELRKREPDFSEKQFGYSGFLQFVRAADTRGFVDLEWVSDIGDYRVSVPA